jgi:intermediate peptidase
MMNNAVNYPSSTPLAEIPEADRLLAGMGSQFVDSLPHGTGHSKSSVFVNPASMEAQHIAHSARSGDARQIMYRAQNRTEPDRVNVVETMLKQRAELAEVLGSETYAQLALRDKMAKTPENVDGFLKSLAKHSRPAAQADVDRLRRIKAQYTSGITHPKDGPTGHLPQIYAWDRDIFSPSLMYELPKSDPMDPYLSVGTVMNGLSKLFNRLYGISFRPASVAPGEVWDGAVRRLDVVHETEGPIGVIYTDLWTRPGKSSAAAHFTVRCSRRVDDDDPERDGLEPGWDSHLGPGLETEGVTIHGKEGRYQLPIVVLSMDFGPFNPTGPSFLSWSSLETLFHEMGHAIHCKLYETRQITELIVAMIGRTEYHNVSGTRCATDFVELPSILMEHFAASPQVLSFFAQHHQTGKQIPPEVITAQLAQSNMLEALDTHSQIVMAILDQQYHSLTSAQLRDPSFNSTRMLHDLQNRTGMIPAVEGTSWQVQFSHLYGYGATYYSYLFDRAIAGKVWSTLFTDGPDGALSREGGEVFKDKVLKWGGGKNPWEMVGDVIGGREGEIVSKGDTKSMETVGSWLAPP